MISGLCAIAQFNMAAGRYYEIPELKPDGEWLKHLRQHDPCVYCGNTRSGTIDHINPTSGGGEDTYYNKAPACEDCNRKKGSIELVPFLMFRKVLYGEYKTLSRKNQRIPI